VKISRVILLIIGYIFAFFKQNFKLVLSLVNHSETGLDPIQAQKDPQGPDFPLFYRILGIREQPVPPASLISPNILSRRPFPTTKGAFLRFCKSSAL